MQRQILVLLFRDYFNVHLHVLNKSIYILYQYEICIKFLLKPAKIDKQQPKKKMFVYLFGLISTLKMSEYHSHILHIFAKKTLLEFFS